MRDDEIAGLIQELFKKILVYQFNTIMLVFIFLFFPFNRVVLAINTLKAVQNTAAIDVIHEVTGDRHFNLFIIEILRQKNKQHY